jgi:hypothetical protein
MILGTCALLFEAVKSSDPILFVAFMGCTILTGEVFMSNCC